MKKVYTLSHYDYDGNSEYSFIHPNNKLRAEFEQDVQNLLIKYTPIFVARGGILDEDLENMPDNHTWIGTDGLIAMVAKHLPKLGYLVFEEQFDVINFGFSGSGIIQRDDRKEPLLNLLPIEIVESIYSHNESVENRLNERLNIVD